MLEHKMSFPEWIIQDIGEEDDDDDEAGCSCWRSSLPGFATLKESVLFLNCDCASQFINGAPRYRLIPVPCHGVAV